MKIFLQIDREITVDELKNIVSSVKSIDPVADVQIDAHIKKDVVPLP